MTLFFPCVYSQTQQQSNKVNGFTFTSKKNDLEIDFSNNKIQIYKGITRQIGEDVLESGYLIFESNYVVIKNNILINTKNKVKKTYFIICNDSVLYCNNSIGRYVLKGITFNKW